MRLVLLGGAPGVGKSTAAHHLLEEVYRHRRSERVLVQWIEVESMWRHQPWQINHRTTQLRNENLRALLANAQRATVDVVVVTWVFADVEQYDLVVSLAPAGVDVMTVQLTASEPVWRLRFGSDPLRQPIAEVDVQRFVTHSTTGSDHVVLTDGLDGGAVGRVIAGLVLSGREATAHNP